MIRLIAVLVKRAERHAQGISACDIIHVNVDFHLCAIGAKLQDIFARTERDGLSNGVVADRVAEARFQR
jgi:hypothetical protein